MKRKLSVCAVGLAAFFMSLGANAQQMFSIGSGKDKKVYTFSDIKKEEKTKAYEIEKNRYQLVEGFARQKYLDYFWAKEAKKTGKSVDQARAAYMKAKSTVSDKEVEESYKQYKDLDQLKKIPEAQRKSRVKQWMQQMAERRTMSEILQQAYQKKEINMSVSEPEEPKYNIPVLATDKVRYGPAGSDIKPTGCRGDQCVTIVEFSEPECPYCRRVAPTIKQLLSQYKGKIRWILRDFPLSFHKRAKPAMIAAHCAKDKYWHFVGDFFENGKLQDADFANLVKKHKINSSEFNKCVKDPKIGQLVDSNMQSGVKIGVSGTPTFFVDGKRMGGAVPMAQFSVAIEKALSAKKKKG